MLLRLWLRKTRRYASGQRGLDSNIVNFEDFVNMGPIGARKAREILDNVGYIVTIELTCAAQAIDFRGSEKLGNATKAAYELRARL